VWAIGSTAIIKALIFAFYLGYKTYTKEYFRNSNLVKKKSYDLITIDSDKNEIFLKGDNNYFNNSIEDY
jgi:hypothetical protein